MVYWPNWIHCWKLFLEEYRITATGTRAHSKNVILNTRTRSRPLKKTCKRNTTITDGLLLLVIVLLMENYFLLNVLITENFYQFFVLFMEYFITHWSTCGILMSVFSLLTKHFYQLFYCSQRIIFLILFISPIISLIDYLRNTSEHFGTLLCY